MSGWSLDGMVGTLAALGDGIRVRTLLLLSRSELNVGELSQILQLPQSTVSRHLRTLSDAGWVAARSDGPRRVYRLRDGAGGFEAPVWKGVRAAAVEASEAQADAERLRTVLNEREERSRLFFRGAAGQWEGIRSELFGTQTDLSALLGLLGPRWRVGDLGCGTGAFSALLAPFAGSVVGVDRQPEMLEAARRRTEAFGNVEIREGELTALPLDDGVLDAAFCLLVLHLLPDPLQALREVSRVLKPGGLLVVVDMRPHGREEYRESMGHVWTGFAAELLEEWLEEAGFTEVANRPLLPETGARGPLLFLLRATAGERGESV